MPSGNIHLTLAFLGNIARDSVPRLESVAAGISAARFELAVSRVEYWRHNRIVWAGPEDCPGALRELAAQLGQALAAEGYRLDDRPFAPHITLVRNAGRAPGPASRPAVSWRVDAFALVESAARGPGRAYQVLREWPLNA